MTDLDLDLSLLWLWSSLLSEIEILNRSLAIFDKYSLHIAWHLCLCSKPGRGKITSLLGCREGGFESWNSVVGDTDRSQKLMLVLDYTCQRSEDRSERHST